MPGEASEGTPKGARGWGEPADRDVASPFSEMVAGRAGSGGPFTAAWEGVVSIARMGRDA